MTDEKPDGLHYVAGIDFAEAELRALVTEDPRPFCHAPGQRCTNMTDCYSSKACQHAPSDEELEAGEMSHCLGGPGFASACEKIAAGVGVPSNVLFPDGGGHGGLTSDRPGPFTPEELRAVGQRMNVAGAVVEAVTELFEKLEAEGRLGPCKSDCHVGPVTVSGKTLCCFSCGTLWNVA